MSQEKLPQVKGVVSAGQDTVTFTLEDGEMVTVTACGGTVILPNGVLLTDWQNNGPAYLIPSPHHQWEAKSWLGLYNGGLHSEEARFDKYLMALTSITEVDWSNDVLTLAHVGRTGQRRFAQFTGDVSANYDWNPSDADFTRFPLRVFIQEGQGEDTKVVGFRVDHTPEGYAVLRALGWLAPLPALEDVRPVSLSEAAD